jgi:hypothetical protein
MSITPGRLAVTPGCTKSSVTASESSRGKMAIGCRLSHYSSSSGSLITAGSSSSSSPSSSSSSSSSPSSLIGCRGGMVLPMRLNQVKRSYNPCRPVRVPAITRRIAEATGVDPAAKTRYCSTIVPISWCNRAEGLHRPQSLDLVPPSGREGVAFGVLTFAPHALLAESELMLRVHERC